MATLRTHARRRYSVRTLFNGNVGIGSARTGHVGLHLFASGAYVGHKGGDPVVTNPRHDFSLVLSASEIRRALGMLAPATLPGLTEDEGKTWLRLSRKLAEAASTDGDA